MKKQLFLVAFALALTAAPAVAQPRTSEEIMNGENKKEKEEKEIHTYHFHYVPLGNNASTTYGAYHLTRVDGFSHQSRFSGVTSSKTNRFDIQNETFKYQNNVRSLLRTDAVVFTELQQLRSYVLFEGRYVRHHYWYYEVPSLFVGVQVQMFPTLGVPQKEGMKRFYVTRKTVQSLFPKLSDGHIVGAITPYLHEQCSPTRSINAMFMSFDICSPSKAGQDWTSFLKLFSLEDAKKTREILDHWEDSVAPTPPQFTPQPGQPDPAGVAGLTWGRPSGALSNSFFYSLFVKPGKNVPTKHYYQAKEVKFLSPAQMPLLWEKASRELIRSPELEGQPKVEVEFPTGWTGSKEKIKAVYSLPSEKTAYTLKCPFEDKYLNGFDPVFPGSWAVATEKDSGFVISPEDLPRWLFARGQKILQEQGRSKQGRLNSATASQTLQAFKPKLDSKVWLGEPFGNPEWDYIKKANPSFYHRVMPYLSTDLQLSWFYKGAEYGEESSSVFYAPRFFPKKTNEVHVTGTLSSWQEYLANNGSEDRPSYLLEDAPRTDSAELNSATPFLRGSLKRDGLDQQGYSYCIRTTLTPLDYDKALQFLKSVDFVQGVKLPTMDEGTKKVQNMFAPLKKESTPSEW